MGFLPLLIAIAIIAVIYWRSSAKREFKPPIASGNSTVANDDSVSEIYYCRNCSGSIELLQKYCLSCGFEPLNGSKYCQQCGMDTKQGQAICTSCGFKLLEHYSDKKGADEEPDKGMFYLGLFIPIVGLIIYLVLNETQPGKATSAGKGALWGFVIGFLLWMLIVASS